MAAYRFEIEARIGSYIRENKVPQKELCGRTGITENAMSLIINEKRRLSASEFVAICDALCLPYSRFVQVNDPLEEK